MKNPLPLLTARGFRISETTVLGIPLKLIPT